MDIKLDTRITVHERDNRLGQYRAEGICDSYVERTAFHPVQIIHAVTAKIRGAYGVTRIRKQLKPRLGESHTVTRTVKQLRPELTFKLFHLLRQSALSHTQ